MIDISKLLFELCGDKNVYNPDFDLIDSGLLDSLMFIELFSELEEQGIVLYPTRINRQLLRTPRAIQKLVNTIHTDWFLKRNTIYWQHSKQSVYYNWGDYFYIWKKGGGLLCLNGWERSLKIRW